LEDEARHAPAKGSRRALDREVYESQAEGAWLQAAGRLGDSPGSGYQDISIDRGFGFFRKWAATDAAAVRGRATPRGAARQDQYGGFRLSGHGLSLGGQRGVHGEER